MDPNSQNPSGEVAEPQRILVVDDEQVIREILCEFLTLEGLRTIYELNT